jgi:undecaprenyl-diphosphatase
MTFQHALIIGFAQGLAITPGISRAGTTIAVALMLGLDRELAARFSFLLAIPAILGAFVLTAKDVDPSHIEADILLIGGVGALVAGYFALTLLVKLVKRGDFSRFCYYVWFMAIVAALTT